MNKFLSTERNLFLFEYSTVLRWVYSNPQYFFYVPYPALSVPFFTLPCATCHLCIGTLKTFAFCKNAHKTGNLQKGSQ
jgi:hypothetical protein